MSCEGYLKLIPHEGVSSVVAGSHSYGDCRVEVDVVSLLGRRRPAHTDFRYGPGGMPYEDMATDRPKYISFLIDHWLDRSSDPKDEFGGAINPLAIGVKDTPWAATRLSQ